MALPTLPATSLSLNGKDVTTEYGLYVSKVTGAEPLTPAKVSSQAIVGLGKQSVGEPIPADRVIRIVGTIGSSTSATDLNQKIAKLSADLGRTTYGFRTLHLAFTQPLLEYEGVYGGEFKVTPVGKVGAALWAEVSFTVSVRLVEAETQPTELTSGTLDATDETVVFLEPAATKGASWKALSVFDEAVIAIKNSNTTQVTAVDFKGFFQKRYKKVSAISSGIIKYDSGHDPKTGSVKWKASDTHTVKYSTTDGVFFPTSRNFQIFMRIKIRFNVSLDTTERVLFSCNNGTDADRTKLFFTTTKLLRLQTGNFDMNTGAYDTGPAITIDNWAYITARIGTFGETLNLNDDAGNTGVGGTIGTQPTPNDPGSHIFIGSNPDGTSPCKCDIGEVAIFGTHGLTILDFGATDPPVMDNNRLRATEWLSFAVDFRAELGLDGVSRGFRELNGLDAGGLIQQNEEIFIDLKRRKVHRIDHDDMDSGRGGDITEKFSGEWPNIGNLSTVEISTTPKQATMTYRINGKAAAIE